MISSSKMYKNLINGYETILFDSIKRWDKGKCDASDATGSFFDRHLFHHMKFYYNHEGLILIIAMIGTKCDRSAISTVAKGSKIYIGLIGYKFSHIESDNDRVIHFLDDSPLQESEYSKVLDSLNKTEFIVSSVDGNKFFPGCPKDMIPIMRLDLEEETVEYYRERLAYNTKYLIKKKFSDISNLNDLCVPDSMFSLKVTRFGEGLTR